MKKIAYISLIGPALVIILRLITIVEQISILGISGDYECAISVTQNCSLFDYLFKGDEAILMYMMMLFSFLFLFLIINYTLLLVRLYKNNNHKLFYTLIALTLIIVVTSSFIVSYIQFIL